MNRPWAKFQKLKRERHNRKEKQLLKVLISILIYLNMFPKHLWKISKNPQTCWYCYQQYSAFTYVNQKRNIKYTQQSNTTSLYVATNLSTYSWADQDVVYDKIIYSYDRTTPYTTNSVVSKGSKPCIGSMLSTDYLKATSTLVNGSSGSFIRGITTTFSLRNIDQKYYSVKKSLNFNHQNCSLIILLILKVQN